MFRRCRTSRQSGAIALRERSCIVFLMPTGSAASPKAHTTTHRLQRHSDSTLLVQHNAHHRKLPSVLQLHSANLAMPRQQVRFLRSSATVEVDKYPSGAHRTAQAMKVDLDRRVMHSIEPKAKIALRDMHLLSLRTRHNLRQQHKDTSDRHRLRTAPRLPARDRCRAVSARTLDRDIKADISIRIIFSRPESL